MKAPGGSGAHYRFARGLLAAVIIAVASWLPGCGSRAPVTSATAGRLAAGDAQTILRRGVAHADLGEHDAAIKEYDSVLVLQPTNAEAYYLRGNARYRLGDQAGAITDYDTALRLNPQLLPAYLARAGAHEARGDHAAASADYEAARRIARDDQVR